MEILKDVRDAQTITTLRAALDEGEDSPDVVGFDPQGFLQEMKADRRTNG